MPDALVAGRYHSAVRSTASSSVHATLQAEFAAARAVAGNVARRQRSGDRRLGDVNGNAGPQDPCHQLGEFGDAQVRL